MALFRTLHAKLSGVLFGLLVLIGLLYIPLTFYSTRMYQREVDQKLNFNLARDLTTHLNAKGLFAHDNKSHDAAILEIKHLMVINPSIDIYLLNPSGEILAYSTLPGKVVRNRISLAPLRKYLSNEARSPILGDDPRGVNMQKVFSAAKIPPQRGDASDIDAGYVYVILGGQGYDSVAQSFQKSYILRATLGVIAATLLLLLCIGSFLFQMLTLRLRRLTKTVERFQQDDQKDHLASVTPPNLIKADEIERLQIVFDQMSQRICWQIEKLTESDLLRRELISNVSHDLRTPLAALQGYLETLHMKEGTLTPEEQRRYLDIASRHSERLSKLVSELFELAKLEASAMAIQNEPFSLTELVQDLVQKYSLTAEKQAITLQAKFTPDLPFVQGDIAMIERVLENLIENAMRYTPEQGFITVSLTHEDSTIKVQLADTGTGILAKDLPNIFHRFYRAPNQSGGTSGAGLGLAITKRILDLHGSDIIVESSSDTGTTFIFHLLLANS